MASSFLFQPGQQPFVPLLICFALGIGLGAIFDYSPSFFLFASSSLLILFAGWIFRFYWLFKSNKKPFLWSSIGLLLITLSGQLHYLRQWPAHQPNYFAHRSFDHLIGQLSQEPEFQPSSIKLIVDLAHGFKDDFPYAIQGKVMVYIRRNEGDSIDWMIGQYLIFPSQFTRIRPPANPHTFDYRRYLNHKGIFHQAYFSLENIHVLDIPWQPNLKQRAQGLQKQLATTFGTFLQDTTARSIASTLILGYRAELSDELMNIFSSTGTIHILSVSGMHVVLVFWLLSLLLGWMDYLPHGRLIRGGILILCVWFYALLTGLSPSVLRAACMITMVILSLTFKKQASVYNSIAGSALLLLLMDPFLLFDVGFQLSYLAVLSIVFCLPWFQKWWPSPHPKLQSIWSYMHLSLAAQLGSFPLAMYYFNQFPLYFLPANLFMALPSSIIMYLGIFLLLNPIERLQPVVGWMLEKSILWTMEGLRWWSALPGSSYQTSAFTISWIGFYYVVIFLTLYGFIRGKRIFLIKAGLLMILLIVWLDLRRVLIHSKFEGVIYHIRGVTAISLISNQHQWLWTDLAHAQDKRYLYQIHPYLKQFGLPTTLHWLGVDTHYVQGSWAVQQGLFLLDQWRLLVLDEPIVANKLPAVDILYLQNNCLLDLNTIQEDQSPGLIIVDGTSSLAQIERWSEVAQLRGWAFHSLQENFAYVWHVKKER